jgi:transcriptional regulator with XRE-family HTH domain
VRAIASDQDLHHSFLDNVYCVLYTTHMKTVFGDYIREKREKQKKKDSSFSLRQVAYRVGVEPSYLSKVERGDQPPPSEGKIKALAEELNENPDVLLAMAGKVSTDLQEIIKQRPELFSQLIKELKDLPDYAVLKIVREVRDGDW